MQLLLLLLLLLLCNKNKRTGIMFIPPTKFFSASPQKQQLWSHVRLSPHFEGTIAKLSILMTSKKQF